MGVAEDLRDGVRRWYDDDRQGLDNLERLLDQNAAAVVGDQRAEPLVKEVRAVIADARQQYPDQPNTAAQAARVRLSLQFAAD